MRKQALCFYTSFLEGEQTIPFTWTPTNLWTSIY